MKKIPKLGKLALEGVRLEFTQGESKGRETYGWATCSLRVHPFGLVASCKGGGFDMQGTCLGEWMNSQFEAELQKLTHWTPAKGRDHSMGHYGIYRAASNGSVYVNGGCGFESMRQILKALGWSMARAGGTSNKDFYVLEVAK